MKKIPYGQQLIDADDITAVVSVLKSEALTQGPAVQQFEASLASYTGARFALVFNSGTAALHAAYFAVGLEKGAEFLTTPITFAATANAGLYLGARPVFVDIDPTTGTIDLNLLEAAVTDKTKLIVPVHYSGQPVDLVKLQKIAKKYHLKVVDDACHALGGEFKGEKIGSGKYSDATVLSFHPVKHITTGEGGALLTNSEEVYERAKQFRTHGITKDTDRYQSKTPVGGWYHEMQNLGFNYRMPDILAALGNSQLKKLDSFIAKRQQIAQAYDAAFANSPYFEIIPQQKNTKHAYHLYPILLKEKYRKHRATIFAELTKQGLGVQVHYIPVHQHPYYQTLGYKSEICPQANIFYARELSIPMYPGMSKAEVKRVIETLQVVFKKIKPRIGAIIQCRANSTRLPNKIFHTLPYSGSKTVLEQVIGRVKQSKQIETVIVATTTNTSDDPVVKIAEKNQVVLFRGSEENVLERFYQAAKEHELDVVVRVTADCPCLDANLIDKIITTHLKQGADVTSNTVVRSFPRGLDVEVFNFAALEQAYKTATSAFEREHVTHFFYNAGKNYFTIEVLTASGKDAHPELRLTLDTPEDYAFLCEIFENLGGSDTSFSLAEVLDLLEKKPWLKLINRRISLEELELTADQKKERTRQEKKLGKQNNFIVR